MATLHITNTSKGVNINGLCGEKATQFFEASSKDAILRAVEAGKDVCKECLERWSKMTAPAAPSTAQPRFVPPRPPSVTPGRTMQYPSGPRVNIHGQTPQGETTPNASDPDATQPPTDQTTNAGDANKE